VPPRITRAPGIATPGEIWREIGKNKQTNRQNDNDDGGFPRTGQASPRSPDVQECAGKSAEKKRHADEANRGQANRASGIARARKASGGRDFTSSLFCLRAMRKLLVIYEAARSLEHEHRLRAGLPLLHERKVIGTVPEDRR